MCGALANRPKPKSARATRTHSAVLRPLEIMQTRADRRVEAKGGQVAVEQCVVKLLGQYSLKSRGSLAPMPPTGLWLECPPACHRSRGRRQRTWLPIGEDPNAVCESPVRASRSGIDTGGTPNFAVTPPSSVISPLRRSRHTTRSLSTSCERSLSGEQIVIRCTVASPRSWGHRGCYGVVRLEFHHRPDADAQRGNRPLRHGKLGQQVLRGALASLVAREHVVAKRPDDTVEGATDVGDLVVSQQAEQALTRPRTAPTGRPSAVSSLGMAK